ncbi:MAG TPA: CheR family methyltransferase [Candidatus Limnocylindrales bacterium]|nr:CheR family methyltransferase [Candidatus Limnocylindrales bacterium]
MAGEVTQGVGTALRLEGSGTELEEIEIRLLLDGIRLTYGYDFREYALSPLRRGLVAAMARENVHTVSAYQDRILHDAACMQRFLGVVGVNVTTMFRDPGLMASIRGDVIPLLKTYPSYRLWVAGCANGEEVYSLAVLLREEGMLGRSNIYATDLNEDMLAVARLGTYPLERLRRYEESYHLSGGRGSLSDHYSIVGRSAHFDRSLQESITWARHNLATDGSFNDFHLIICANVLIYFRATLQERAHRLFYDSLVRGGFLALGKRESLLCCPDRGHYEQVREGVNLYRKLRW